VPTTTDKEFQMFEWLRQLDRILRGEATKPDQIAGGTLRVPIFGLAVVIDLLGMIYGACMGLFAVMGKDTSRWMQIPASMIKVPALFILTLIITVPSLYTFNALVGSRLRMLSVIRLLTAAVAVMLAVLASLGTIVAFFSVSTTSYPFMILLNVAVFTIAGVLGLRFLLQTLHRLTLAVENADDLVTKTTPVETATSADAPIAPPPLRPGALVHFTAKPVGRHVKVVFRIWLIVFALVGAQMGWVLRPFIGNPRLPFTWFRDRESNFFEAVTKNAGKLMGMDWHSRQRGGYGD
jgi:hypothetical protein